MSIAKLLNSIFYKNVKYYKHFISLGYNCENAYRFFQKYHFVESSLFTWTNSINIKNLLHALKNIDIIMLENPEKAGFMWKDISTDIRFHGTEPHDMNIHPELYKYEDFEPFQKELKSRINHLKCKFKQQICDNTKTLFTYTYLPTNETGEEVTNNIISLHKALKSICTNPFDLLCFRREKQNRKYFVFYRK